MRLPLLAILLALTGCARNELDPAAAAEVQAFETELENMRRELPEVYAKIPAGEQDFRGRTVRDDFAQWVFPEETLEQIDSLAQRAAEARGAEEARTILQRARELAQAEVIEAATIAAYWTRHMPAPYWRRHWKAVFEANALPAEEPDSLLVTTEERITAALEKGDFKTAGNVADELTAMLAESLNLASSRILKLRSGSAQFSARKTGCIRGAPPDPARRTAKIIRSDDVESFYPGEAISRGETGAVILRTRVDRAGCGSHVAIVVHSGVASLDAAALSWFESAQFSPAMAGNQVIESELIFKVKFELRDR